MQFIPRLMPVQAAADGSDDGMLVAVDSRSDWLFVEQKVGHLCDELLQLLPRQYTERLLAWPAGAGELLDLLGCQPAPLAQLAASVLLPALLPVNATPAADQQQPQQREWGAAQDKLLLFVRQNWGHLHSDAAVKAHLAQAAWVEVDAPAASPGVEGGALDAPSSVQRGRPSDLFDASVPLFKAVLGSMAQSMGASGAVFPGRSFQGHAWESVSAATLPPAVHGTSTACRAGHRIGSAWRCQHPREGGALMRP
jgi:hypothetical protein